MSEQQVNEATPAAAEALEASDQVAAPEAAEVPAAEIAAPVSDADSADSADAGGPVVRMLSVGQQVKGTVKRVTEFGAFVDIGVGRDGLVHISELSAKRVGKVSDVLQEGQVVDLWIKKLDRDRNRISLTMIEPGKRTIRDLQKGEVVEGTVTRILPYGAFVDIGVKQDGLLHKSQIPNGTILKVGDIIDVEIQKIEAERGRIGLGWVK